MLSLNISIYTDALMHICNLETFMHRPAMKFRFKFETVHAMYYVHADICNVTLHRTNLAL